MRENKSMMSSRSKRNKGNRFENYLIEDLRKEVDEKAHRTYGSGNGLDKNDINIPAYDIEIEAKNQMTIKFMDWWEQAERPTTDRTTVLAIRNPRKAEFQQTLIVMDYEDWKELVKGQKEETTVVNNFDDKLKWKIKRLKDYANEVVKEL